MYFNINAFIVFFLTKLTIRYGLFSFSNDSIFITLPGTITKLSFHRYSNYYLPSNYILIIIIIVVILIIIIIFIIIPSCSFHFDSLEYNKSIVVVIYSLVTIFISVDSLCARSGFVDCFILEQIFTAQWTGCADWLLLELALTLWTINDGSSQGGVCSKNK